MAKFDVYDLEKKKVGELELDDAGAALLSVSGATVSAPWPRPPDPPIHTRNRMADKLSCQPTLRMVAKIAPTPRFCG